MDSIDSWFRDYEMVTSTNFKPKWFDWGEPKPKKDKWTKYVERMINGA